MLNLSSLFLKKPNLNLKTSKAFTLVELIVVILIVGILALIALPKIEEKDRLPEAVEQVTADIRLAQLLSLQNNYVLDQSGMTDRWYFRRWRFELAQNIDHQCPLLKMKMGYNLIFGDELLDHNRVYADIVSSRDRSVRRRVIFKQNSNAICNQEFYFNLSKYGVNMISTTCAAPNGAGAVGQLGFDEFGRPMLPFYLGRGYGGNHPSCSNPSEGCPALIFNRCSIDLSTGERMARIWIEPQTGYISEVTYLQIAP